METAESLGKLRLSELQKKARASGIPSDQVDDAADADDPRQELIGLILETLQASGAALRAELGELRLGSLQKRARAAGLDGDRVDDAADADDPKTELIAMIMELHQASQLQQQQLLSSGGGAVALSLSPSHLRSPSLSGGSLLTPDGVPPTLASMLGSSPPPATLQRHHSFGAEALREAGHAVLHQHHLEDTMGAQAATAAWLVYMRQLHLFALPIMLPQHSDSILTTRHAACSRVAPTKAAALERVLDKRGLWRG